MSSRRIVITGGGLWFHEYAFVPAPVFREKRRAILQSFIARPRIYSTSHFAGLLEQQARINLARAVGEARDSR